MILVNIHIINVVLGERNMNKDWKFHGNFMIKRKKISLLFPFLH